MIPWLQYVQFFWFLLFLLYKDKARLVADKSQQWYPEKVQFYVIKTNVEV